MWSAEESYWEIYVGLGTRRIHCNGRFAPQIRKIKNPEWMDVFVKWKLSYPVCSMTRCDALLAPSPHVRCGQEGATASPDLCVLSLQQKPGKDKLADKDYSLYLKLCCMLQNQMLAVKNGWPSPGSLFQQCFSNSGRRFPGETLSWAEVGHPMAQKE